MVTGKDSNSKLHAISSSGFCGARMAAIVLPLMAAGGLCWWYHVHYKIGYVRECESFSNPMYAVTLDWEIDSPIDKIETQHTR